MLGGPKGHANGGANPAHRTAANWMAKQPPLSPTRNPREISGRINTGGIAAGENLLASQ